jgi:hypothetical protein
VSWIKRRPALTLAVVAFALRVACAVVTQYKPIFPAYYYTDADLTHDRAARALQEMRAGRPPAIAGDLSVRIQTALTLGVYEIFGPRPLCMKIFMAALGALSILFLVWGLEQWFESYVSFAVGCILAFWPSHIFYTSQNLKEAPSTLLTYAALAAILFLLKTSAVNKRLLSYSLFALIALVGTGLYRAYVLVCLSTAFLLAIAWQQYASRLRSRGAWAAGVAIILSLALYPFISSRVQGVFQTTSSKVGEEYRNRATLIPRTYDEFDRGVISRPTSPEGITRFRQSRQFGDRRWANVAQNRTIGTQIYPDAEFRTWLDVLLYFPKGAFSVLFMPLPGFYPMDGKVGRYAAGLENMLLLILAVLAAFGLSRGVKTSGRLGLLGFFALMSAGGALLEFDLGSAGRHKLLYLPMLFPFAVEEGRRLIKRRR